MKNYAITIVLICSAIFVYSQTTVSGTNITHNAGLVGIGITTPENNLHVHSTLHGTLFAPVIGPKGGFLTTPLGIPKLGVVQITNSTTGSGKEAGLRMGVIGNSGFMALGGDNKFTFYRHNSRLSFHEDGTLNYYDEGDGPFTDAMKAGLVNIRVGNFSSGLNIFQFKKGVALNIKSETFGTKLPTIIRHSRDGIDNFRVMYNGKTMIGDVTGFEFSPISEFMLEVDGSIRSCGIKIYPNSWCDYVFEDDYTMMSLGELEKYLKAYKHLPEIPSAEEVAEDGINVGEMNMLLLKKIEELTLYTLEQQKLIELLSARLLELEKQ